MAVYPNAPGHPDYSSSGTNRFIPEIWSGKMIEKFYNATVLSAISNTAYEGEIKSYGDNIIIRTVPTISIHNYSKGQDLDYENPESAAITMPIDKGKYFAYDCEDVDKHQADINFVNVFAEDSAQQMKIAIDSDVLNASAVYSGAHSSNIGATAGAAGGSYNMGVTGTPVSVTSTNVLQGIIDMGSVLSEQNIPETGRWVVIPAWMANLLKKSDIKDASLTGDGSSTLRNGRIGMIDTFTLYTTNQYISVTDTTACFHVLFGHPVAISFAAQMTKLETLRNPRGFGDLVRGLNVYGYKVTNSVGLGDFYCTNGS